MTQLRQPTSSRLAAIVRVCGFVFVLAALTTTSGAVESENSIAPRFSALRLPLYFEASRNQTGDIESFVARGRGCNFLVTPTEAVLSLVRHEPSPDSPRAGHRGEERSRVTPTRVLRFEFLGADARAPLSGLGELAGRVNYLLGNDPAQWQTGLALFAQARVEKIYPGVDLVYYANQQRLEYDFIVAPGADPRTIAIRFSGADKIHVDAQGDLVFKLGREEIHQPRPHLYQTIAGVRKEISGGYELADGNTATFRIGEYDHDQTLVIDPLLSYATFFGGTGSDIGWDIALDSSGSVYVAGETMSAGLATPGAFQITNRLGTQYGGDAFVAKFDNLCTTLSYLTYLGGRGDDAALALAVDGAGNAFITGFTSSTNFPTTNALYAKIGGTNDPTFGVYPLDAFVTGLNTNGSALLFSSYLGGSADDEGIGIAVDPSGNTYVTGFTDSTNFPAAGASRTNYNGGRDAFVTKLGPGGSTFVYSIYLGGTNLENGEGIAADAAGNAYVTGFTTSTNFPITNAAQPFLNNPPAGASNHLAGAADAFITRINPDGSALVYSTFLGGARDDIGFRLTLDAETNVFVAGSALSLDFPTAPASNTNLLKSVTATNFLPDVFAAKLGAAGTNWEYAVVFGGTNRDEAWDIAVDLAGNAHLVGVTYSTNFPTVGATGVLRATNSGAADAFVAMLGSDGTALVRSVLLGGSSGDFGYGIEVDAAGNDYFVGKTSSTNFPTLASSQSAFGGTNDAFVAKIVGEPTLSATAAGENVVIAWPPFAPEFTLQSNANLSSSNNWMNVAIPPVLDAGQHTVTLGATNELLFFRLRKP